MPRFIPIASHIALDEAELDEVFVTAPGPGGQNVNKVATAVQLRFPLERTKSLPDDVRARLRKLAGKRVSADGWLIIEANRFRSQARNREDARTRLVELIRKALHAPKQRRATRPTLGSIERRLQDKRKRALTKRTRGRDNET